MTQQEKKPEINVINFEALPSEKQKSTLSSIKKKKRNGWRLRILPLMIVVFALFLTVRANEALKDFSIGQLYAQQPFGDNQGVSSTSRQIPGADDWANGNERNTIEAPPQPAPATVPARVMTIPIEAATSSMVTASGRGPSGASSAPMEINNNLSPSELVILQKLAERRAELEGRVRELDRREASLKAGVLKIDEKIGQLKALQNEVDSLLKKYNQQEDEKMRSLVRVYENMKPKDAARIFEQLDMTVLLDIIERMKEQKFAPILAEMDVRKASAVSTEMAQRRQLPLPSVSGG